MTRANAVESIMVMDGAGVGSRRRGQGWILAGERRGAGLYDGTCVGGWRAVGRGSRHFWSQQVEPHLWFASGSSATGIRGRLEVRAWTRRESLPVEFSAPTAEVCAWMQDHGGHASCRTWLLGDRNADFIGSLGDMPAHLADH